MEICCYENKWPRSETDCFGDFLTLLFWYAILVIGKKNNHKYKLIAEMIQKILEGSSRLHTAYIFCSMAHGDLLILYTYTICTKGCVHHISI